MRFINKSLSTVLIPGRSRFHYHLDDEPQCYNTIILSGKLTHTGRVASAFSLNVSRDLTLPVLFSSGEFCGRNADWPLQLAEQ